MSERIFRIGTAKSCEIIVKNGIPANVVWVRIAANDDGTHLLIVDEPEINCYVNGTRITTQYWVKDKDLIEIEGKILNWDYINGDSDRPFKNVNKNPNKTLYIILCALAGVCLLVGLVFLILHFVNKEEPVEVHIPTASERYESALSMIAADSLHLIDEGRAVIQQLAIDSLYVPAVYDYYDHLLSAKDTVKWESAFNCMLKISEDDANLRAMYECALCMSFISPKLSLPEVRRYDFIKNKDYNQANRLFDRLLDCDPDNYKAPFWEIMNLIYNNNSVSTISNRDRAKLKECYNALTDNLASTTDPSSENYRNETERVIKVILRNWHIID